MKKVLLYSGGMDSFIISHLWKPDVKLYIDYGTEQTKEERKRLPADVIVKEIDLAEYIEKDGLNTIPLRNLLFATIAINYGDEVAIGGVKGDLHYDKTKEFCYAATELFNSVLTKERSHRQVNVVVPYKDYTKEELIYLYIQNGGDIELLKNNTWSCYRPIKGKACGECSPCRRRNAAIQDAINKINKERENEERV